MNDYQLPGFEFLERIGQGSFADVWKAKQTILGRFAAIKILTSTSTGDSDYNLFTQECQALARLERAPNIVQIFDAGILEQGHPYIVLEYIDGGTLRDLSLRGQPTEPELIRMLGQAASGLRSAHAIGVLHRDIKPENLLLRSSGNVVLSDFGVARLSVNERTQTSTNEPGTIRYMAPEVIEGTADSSVRSDTYSLAATFWSVAAQRQPFEEAANAAQVIFKATTSDLGPLTTFGYSDGLSYLIERCLSKNPMERPDASELVAALSQTQLPSRVTGSVDQTLLRRPQAANQVPASEPGPTKKTYLPAILLGAGLAVAAIAGFAVYQTVGRPEQATDTTSATSVATKNDAAEHVEVGNSPTRPVLAEGSVWVVNSDDGTVSQVDVVERQTARTIKVGGSPWIPTEAGGFVWVPNNEDGTVSKIDAKSGEVVATIEVGRFPGQPSYGNSMVVVPNEGDSTLSLIGVDSTIVSATVPTLTVPGTPAFYETLVIVTSPVEPEASIINIATLEEVRRFETGAGSLAPVVFEDKAWITNLTAGTVTVWDFSTNERASLTVEGAATQPHVHQGRALIPTSSSVEIYNAATLVAETSITLPQQAVGLSIEGDTAWVTTATELLELDLVSQEIASTRPTCLTAAPPTLDDNGIWITCNSTNQLQFVEYST